ncbi:DUF1648 domain-containing protein [Kitasatospora sp. NPDC088391]|uniref:DUF1648 domain-containing protein n=1 Tax=Kitasatospora sp. NPDC088391 TaxID=3364074 RepID=UPI003828B0E9
MTGPEDPPRGGLLLPTAWWAVTAALTAVLPLLAADRLPAELATHWSGRTANGSMPFWAACAVPALLWAALGGVALFGVRRGVDPGFRAWSLGGLAAGGVLFPGLQAVSVGANLDRADWHTAALPLGGFLGVLAASLATGAAVRLLTGRGGPVPAPPAVTGPVLELADGERLVWFSRAVNRPLGGLAAVGGLLAAAALPLVLTGVLAAGPGWTLFAVSAVVGAAGASCCSVRARVSAAGLEVALGPLGLPTRRWSPAELDSARVEVRTAARVGGWGYRLSGLGTTVMLRSGECLVVRLRATGQDFAVSVDDAGRGAALLNALLARQRA